MIKKILKENKIEKIFRSKKIWIWFMIIIFLIAPFLNLLVQLLSGNLTLEYLLVIWWIYLIAIPLGFIFATKGLIIILGYLNILPSTDPFMYGITYNQFINYLLFLGYLGFWIFFIYFIRNLKVLSKSKLYLFGIIILFLVLLTLGGCSVMLWEG